MKDSWHEAQLGLEAFRIHHLAPISRALLLSGSGLYVVLVLTLEHLGGNRFSLAAKLSVLALLVPVCLASLRAGSKRALTLAGWVVLGLLQVGILLSTLSRPDAVDWMIPAFMSIIMAAGLGWIETPGFVVGMLITLGGPAFACWFLRPDSADLIRGGLSLAVALAVAAIAHAFSHRQLDAQFRLHRELARLAGTDSLTGLANRMQFFALGDSQVAEALSAGEQLSALYIDVDNFKVINDRHGHATGDQALVAIATALDASIPAGSLLGRIGGDEFAILLPGTGREVATNLGKRLHAAVSDLHLDGDAVSISVGVAGLQLGDTCVNQLLIAADLALQRAKQLGRGRVEVAVADGASRC